MIRACVYWLASRKQSSSALTCVFVLVATLWSTGFAAEQTLTAIDKPLPEFSLQGVGGETYDPQTLKGKTWLINFWAVWCAPCLEELPALNNAWAQMKDKNIGMLAINIGEDANKIEQFLADNNLQIDFPVVIGDKIRTLGNWSVTALPHTFIVSPAGRIVYEASGDREWDDPRFVDAIVALSELPIDTSVSSQIAAAIAQFHRMTTVLKVTLVLVMIFAVVLLMLLIRRLHRRKVTS